MLIHISAHTVIQSPDRFQVVRALAADCRAFQCRPTCATGQAACGLSRARMVATKAKAMRQHIPHESERGTAAMSY
jgi:hypothetical protein